MKKLMITLVLTIMLLAVLATAVSAGDFMDANGQYCFTTPVEGPYEMIFAGPNIIEHIATTDEWTGTIAGTGSSDVQLLLKNFPDGFWLGHIDLHLDNAAVDGKTGELFMRLSLSTPNGFIYQGGTWNIIGGTGELAGLHGSGTWAGGGVGPFGTTLCTDYTGTYHFTP